MGSGVRLGPLALPILARLRGRLCLAREMHVAGERAILGAGQEQRLQPSASEQQVRHASLFWLIYRCGSVRMAAWSMYR